MELFTQDLRLTLYWQSGILFGIEEKTGCNDTVPSCWHAVTEQWYSDRALYHCCTDQNTVKKYSDEVKLTIRDESCQKLNLVKPTQYDGRSHINSG